MKGAAHDNTITLDLITLPEAARRYGLDTAAVQRVRQRLAGAAVEHHPGQASVYPLATVLEAIRADRDLRRGVPTFGPAPDLFYCACGKSWIDAASKQRHIDRDHGGVEPPVALDTPVQTYTLDLGLPGEPLAPYYRNYPTRAETVG